MPGSVLHCVGSVLPVPFPYNSMHFIAMADQEPRTWLCTDFYACCRYKFISKRKKKRTNLQLKYFVSVLIASFPLIMTLLPLSMVKIPKGALLLVTHVFPCATRHVMSWCFTLPHFCPLCGTGTLHYDLSSLVNALQHS